MKILIATPVFNSMMHMKYVNSFLSTSAVLSAHGHQVTLAMNDRDGLISMARNFCAKAAMEKGFDKLLFIDADIVWRPEDVLKLLESKEMIVGGTYPYKELPIRLVFNAMTFDVPQLRNKTVEEFLDFNSWMKSCTPDWNGELEVKALPTGFLMIDVSVFNKLKDVTPTYIRAGSPGQQQRLEHNFFRVGLYKDDKGQNLYETEDFGFCNLARENGYKIYLQTKVVVGHVGLHEYKL